MKISKSSLKSIIRKYLNEGEEPGEELNLDAPDDEYGSLLGPEDYEKEYKEKSKLVIDKIDFIYNETIKKFKEKSKEKPDEYQDLTEKQKKTLKSYLNNIRVVLIKKFPDDPRTVASAAGLRWIMSDDESGEKTISSPSKSASMEDITDDLILGGKKHFDEYMKNPRQNPIIVISSDKFRPSMVKVTPQDLADIVVHELDHIKYGILYLYDKKFNVKDIEKVLRKDLVGKSSGEISKIFEKEGLFKGVDSLQKTGYVTVMNKHYQNIFGAKEAIDTADYEEFAVRINILTRHSEKTKILERYSNQNISLKEVRKKYGMNISQVLPYLKRSASLNDLDKVVKLPDDVIEKQEQIT